MTTLDYLLVMKVVRIAELKARLSQYLREVRRGHTLTVMDRQTPVASLIPYAPAGEPLRVRAPLGRFPSPQDVPLPPPLVLEADVVKLLLEERLGGR